MAFGARVRNGRMSGVSGVFQKTDTFGGACYRSGAKGAQWVGLAPGPMAGGARFGRPVNIFRSTGVAQTRW